ncbi:Flagellar protein FliT [Thiorhodovibrio winogradskyi]|uniref:Flagellar protein FliT n=1 Tax=Thiorhodovibrio winogradskyi TaxID=77007 RepID=A0ABZ0SCF9_9GAMM|nr:flagellar protein FliT [Thiorhodovibrio winogradskyi]
MGTAGTHSEPAERTLERVMTLTRDLLERAQAGDWEDFPERQARRDAALHALLDPEPRLPAERLREPLAELQAMDRQLIALTESQRDRLQQELLQLMRGRKSARAYLGQ